MAKNNNKTECCNPHNIVSDFYDKILGYVIKKVNDIDIAKDITQEVMGRMIDAYDKQLQVNNIKAWLFQVTRNIIADRYRRKDFLNYVDTEIESSDEDEIPAITAEDFIVPMIKLLPDEYSVPLYMSDIDNMKQSEIAEKLNLSLSATKMRCQRARKKLHELFLECCDIEYTESGAFAHCTIKASCDQLHKIEKDINKNR
ncbi:MAG: sigma-70 family RNA polymerase sigma factor [Bacteroidales bacterium]|jgi:RNA polymerase sigma-70 factor (ECF subfamily)|nr:sigma-70 family RNA polymerase sigma factor [Bacteroidales bacterium]